MRFQTEYDIPEEMVHGSHSPAFDEFLRVWFVDSVGLLRREVDLGFLRDLSPDEKDVAKALLRRNLKLKHTHIIEGVAALHDMESVPILQAMLGSEDDPSRQLTIAGSLWKLSHDESFVDYLIRMKDSNRTTLKRAHLRQILWLRDERAIDLLTDMLEDDDEFVRFRVLKILNELEFGRSFLLFSKEEMLRQASDYQKRRHDKVLRELMVANMQKRMQEIP